MLKYYRKIHLDVVIILKLLILIRLEQLITDQETLL